jgi:hypothetical protein
MKKIKVEIIISGLEDWGTDWNNESSVEVTLNEVESEIKYAIRNSLGITSSNIEISAEIDE